VILNVRVLVLLDGRFNVSCACTSRLRGQVLPFLSKSAHGKTSSFEASGRFDPFSFFWCLRSAAMKSAMLAGQ
jgi:hypothetical protein